MPSYNKSMAKDFDGQYEDEEVVFIIKNHIIKIRKAFYILFILFLIASIPVLIWPDNINNLWIAFAGLGFGLLIFFYHWLGWYFSMIIVTNQRMRQITQKGFFNKSIIDLNLSKIQNISYNVPGLSASIFKYGTLVVQTYVGDLYIDKVSNPERNYNDLCNTIKTYVGTNQIMSGNENEIA